MFGFEIPWFALLSRALQWIGFKMGFMGTKLELMATIRKREFWIAVRNLSQSPAIIVGQIRDIRGFQEFISPYNVRWENAVKDTPEINLMEENTADAKLFEAHGVDNEGVEGINISQALRTRGGHLRRGTSIEFTIFITSNPRPRKRLERRYRLSLDNDGQWCQLEEWSDK